MSQEDIKARADNLSYRDHSEDNQGSSLALAKNARPYSKSKKGLGLWLKW
jgi:hypothetical protein